MKSIKIFLSGLLLIISSVFASAQDVRTLNTKIADLLAQLPANDPVYTAKLMDNMYALGEEGLTKICDQVIPAGTGDDTKARYAIESLSRHLSQIGKEKERLSWEKVCISFIESKTDKGVRDFFMKQLQMIGGDASVDALKKYVPDKDDCASAVSAISAIGGKKAEQVLSEFLKQENLPSPAAAMNALAGMKSGIAVRQYIFWTKSTDDNIRGAAYNALAMSRAPEAYNVLLDAAKKVEFRWDPAGSTASLINYAKTTGDSGNLKTAAKICKLLIAKCNDKSNLQYKTAALNTFVSLYGSQALPVIFKAAKSPDKDYRNAAINSRFSPEDYPGVIEQWIKYYPKAAQFAKPEIIRMFGETKDGWASDFVKKELNSSDSSVRTAAAAALPLLIEKDAAIPLIDYLLAFDSPSDQTAAVSAFKTCAGKEQTDLLRLVLKNGSDAAKKSAIEILAWTTNNDYFKDVLPYTSSQDGSVREASFKSLRSLAGAENQNELLDLLKTLKDLKFQGYLQDALASAAGKIRDDEKRSTVILRAMQNSDLKPVLIPVLARTGGREALSAVLKEFETGNQDMKAKCFQALSSWRDYSASSALYEICASGNESYKNQAFEGYVRQIRTAPLADEQKLLLLRKIMPYAATASFKNEVLVEIGKLKTYPALYFVSDYLDDQATSSAAARASMTIALPSSDSRTGMYGKLVSDILMKAAPKLTGSESDYEREQINKYVGSMPSDEGFVKIFNGKDLTGWHGLVENPIARAKMKPEELAKKQAEADKNVPLNWSVKDGCIWFNGKGDNLCSVKEYSDFEMLVDWRITKKGDSGIYLRGSPQVQIWDTSRIEVGAQVGSGGLYNNKKNLKDPLKVADNPVGDWNTFRILMVGDKVTVWLNGQLVVDNVTMENYWDYSLPIFAAGPVELQAHGTDLAFRDIYIREISEKEYNLTPEEKADGFVSLFNGRNLNGWVGNTVSYAAQDGMIVIKTEEGSGGNLYTEKEFSDFVFRFEFQLTPGANNGIGIRAPLTGDAAYVGMEIQVLDNTAAEYANLQPYQYHGSVYGVIPAKRDYLKPVGEWNSEEIMAQGTHIKVTLNGTVIVDGDIAGPRDNGTMDHNQHPGLKNASGHIGFLGHGSIVRFKDIRIKDLSK